MGLELWSPESRPGPKAAPNHQATQGSPKILKKNKQKTKPPQWPSGLALPLARGLILETRDRVPRWAPCLEPASPSACVSASLSVYLS